MPRASAYAEPADVIRHLSFINPATGFTATSRPNATQVHNHLLAVSDELDAALAQVDYTVPIPTAATVSLNLLRQWTSIGAAMHAAAAMPQGQDSRHLEFLERQWTAILNGVSSGDLQLPSDSAKDTALSLPRFPARSESTATPFFYRDAVYDV